MHENAAFLLKLQDDPKIRLFTAHKEPFQEIRGGILSGSVSSLSLNDLGRRQRLTHDYLEKNCGYGFCLMESNPWKTHKVLKKLFHQKPASLDDQGQREDKGKGADKT